MPNEVLSAIQQVAARRKVPYKHLKAAVETGLVESNLKNLSGGDADSAGWRQERKQYYPDNTNLKASVNRFFDEAAKLDQGGISSGELAARVQRPAAQYRGRYSERSGEAKKLLGGIQPSGPAAGQGAGPSFKLQTSTSFDQAGYDQAEKKQFLAQYLSTKRPDSILFKSGVLSTAAPTADQFTSTSSTLKKIPGLAAAQPAATGPTSPAGADAAIAKARSLLGITEVNGSNRGPEVDKLQKGFGMIGQPWCGILVGTALRAAGVKVTSRVASVQAIEQDARAGVNGFRKWLPASEAQAGDALVTSKDNHVVFVTGRGKDGSIKAIGGNTGNGTAARRTYKPSEVYGVARPRFKR